VNIPVTATVNDGQAKLLLMAVMNVDGADAGSVLSINMTLGNLLCQQLIIEPSLSEPGGQAGVPAMVMTVNDRLTAGRRYRGRPGELVIDANGLGGRL